MVLKVQLGEHEYEIRLPARSWPYLLTLSRALAGEPVPEEQVGAAERRVLELCVRPAPCEDHEEEIIARILVRFSEISRSMATSFRGS